jgi:outer membrane receptor protein involved in Fe transport
MYSKCRTSTWLFRPAAVILLSTGMEATTALAADDEQPEGLLQEIVVTATRREESLSRVPISVAAFTQEQMDAQGLKQIDDIQRYTPGLVVTRTGNSGNHFDSRHFLRRGRRHDGRVHR